MHRRLPHLRPFAARPVVFFTACTQGRERLLADERIHKVLASAWKVSGECDGWAVGRYVIMPDHVHLFARQAWDGAAVSTWVRNWRCFSAREINRALGRLGPVWQRDYFDRWARSGESYSEAWDYVRQNPVRAGLVADAEDWPHQGEVVDLRW